MGTGGQITLQKHAPCLRQLFDRYNLDPAQITMQYTKASESIELAVSGLPLLGSLSVTLSQEKCSNSAAKAVGGIDVPSKEELVPG